MIPEKDKYLKAIELWCEWNGKINVISRKDEEHVFEHHILHSLCIAEYLERFYSNTEGSPTRSSLSQNSKLREWELPSDGAPVVPTVLDLGTGGGFPGIPLAMEFPEVRFTLCDSIGKKVRVAQAVAEGLGLRNVECVHARVEELPGQWDFVVSRAVAPLETLFGWAGGKFRRSLICLKGGDVNEEISLLLQSLRRKIIKS